MLACQSIDSFLSPAMQSCELVGYNRLLYQEWWGLNAEACDIEEKTTDSIFMAEKTRPYGWSRCTYEMTFTEDRETEIRGWGGDTTACCCITWLHHSVLKFLKP